MKKGVEKINNLIGLFRELLVISRQQFDIIQNCGLDDEQNGKLMKLIEQRQKIMDNIDTASNELAGKGSGNATWLEHLSPADFEELQRIMGLIQENDKKSQEEARKIVKITGARLGDARKSKKAYDLYNQPGTPLHSWFFDRSK